MQLTSHTKIISRLLSPLLRPSRRLPHCEQGSVTIIVAFAVMMLVIALGSGIDMWRAWTVKARLQSAVDAAALAIGSTNQSQFTQAQLQARVQAFFTANYPSTALGTPSAPSLSFANNNNTINVSASSAAGGVQPP